MGGGGSVSEGGAGTQSEGGGGSSSEGGLDVSTLLDAGEGG
jgi:hypothetical protein